MKTKFRKSFEKDLKNILAKKILIKIKEVIEEIEKIRIWNEIKT